MKSFLLLLFSGIVLTSCSLARPADENQIQTSAICMKVLQVTGKADCDSALEALLSGYREYQQRLQKDLAPPVLNDVVEEECVCSQETSNDVAPDIALPILPTD